MGGYCKNNMHTHMESENNSIGVYMNSNISLSSGDAMGATDQFGVEAIPNVLLVYCRDTGSKGTGFLIDGGYVVTNYHVIEGSKNIKNILLLNSDGQIVEHTAAQAHIGRDLAVFVLKDSPSNGFKLASENSIPTLGSKVITWGHPLGYNGPAPIISVGYLGGLAQSPYPANAKQTGTVKRHVVNGAFNSGNSGGALLNPLNNEVIGVVVNKHGGLSSFRKQCLEAIKANKSGFNYTATDENGQQHSFSEGQLVAGIIDEFLPFIQVMIGEAVHVTELKTFMREVGYT